MTIDEILKCLNKECWVFEAWSEHPTDKDMYFTVKLTCGCQARGRVEIDGETLPIAIQKAYDYVINKWGKLESTITTK